MSPRRSGRADRSTPAGRALLRSSAPLLTRLSRRRLPPLTGRVALRGLHDAVEVIRDRWGVPHIYANSAADLCFAQGYLHAQDRLWQLDVQRRLASGRLAEVLGARALPVDRLLRILGFRRVATVETERLTGEALRDMQAYAAGVNAWIEQGHLPLEFVLLRYRPEPWTPTDSLAWAKMISWSLSMNWESELLRARLVALLGAERAAELEPDYPERCPLVVPAGVRYEQISEDARRLAAQARPFTGPSVLEGVGSNNWAVSGARSATGTPLLAGDMHLPLGIPAIWYENHLVVLTQGDDAVDVTGISLPGAPGVVAGHNGHVAWSFTASFADVQDIYIEQLRPDGAAGFQCEYAGSWEPVEALDEVIRVRGGRVVTERVLMSRHGPLIDALAGDLCQEGAIALRWTAFDPETMVTTLRRVNRAQTCAEFREALRAWSSPAVNVVYADTQGEIAYQLAGRVPVRARGDGRLPVPGWTGEYEWLGYIPFDELPARRDPPEGYLVTANNKIVADDYPHFISSEYATGNRAQRIVELITARAQLDLADMQAMQFDQVSPLARVVARVLGALAPEDAELADVVARLRAWDGRLAPDSMEAAVCQSVALQLVRLMLGDRLGALTERYLGRGPAPVVAEGSLYAHRAQEWLEQQLSQPDATWDEVSGESREAVMLRALRAALDDLRRQLGDDDWRYGLLHTVTFTHPLGAVEPFASVFNRGPYPVGGDSNTIWATGHHLDRPRSGNTIGPPFRFVADVGDLRHAWAILAPGQSGQPGSPFYDDQIPAWFTGDYHPMLYDRAEIVGAAFARLTLQPNIPPEPRSVPGS